MPDFRTLAPALLAALLLLLAGCTRLPSGSWSLDLLTRPDTTRSEALSAGGDAREVGVEVDGDGSVFSRPAAAALSPQRLQTEVADLLAEDQRGTAVRLVQRYPEVAWERLRSAPPEAAETAALRAMAAAHDAQVRRSGTATGWEELLDQRERRPEPYTRYARRRAEFVALLRQQRPAEALQIGLLPQQEDALPLLLALDAQQLTARALRRDGRAGAAAELLQRAVRQARQAPPYYEAQLRLEASEAWQHAGQFAAAGEAWQAAVRQAGRTLLSDPPLFDPSFWQQAAETRPADRTWPSEAIDRLADLAAETGAWGGPLPPNSEDPARQAAPERFVWACIGHWRLERGEPQAALVAWKRAHALGASDEERHHFEWGQARALIALDQPSAATALLLALSDRAASPTREAALATLGTLRLEAGNTKQGFQLLQRALEDEPHPDWPGRARAEADLGLAYLLLGNQQAGLEWLQKAQARFERSGDHDQLLLSLLNEQAYWEQAGEKRKAQAVQQRIQRWK